MFTGIIEEIGAVSRRSGHDIALLADVVRDGLALGESVAVNGACLTVAALDEGGFVVQASPETLERSTVGQLRPGDPVNLERAMTPRKRFGGHFVLGHVDGVGRLASVRAQGEFAVYEFNAPQEVARYLVPKGSVAVDGISLTVVEPSPEGFRVAVIPSTLQMTTLTARKAGDLVNLEADMIGKHIYHYINNPKAGGLTKEMLARYGFI